MCVNDPICFKSGTHGNLVCVDCGSALFNPFHYCSTCRPHKAIEVDAIDHTKEKV